MSNLTQVMGPMMQSMQAQVGARPCATAEGAVATVPAGRSSHKHSAQQKKRHLRPRERIGSSQVGAAHLRGHRPRAGAIEEASWSLAPEPQRAHQDDLTGLTHTLRASARG